MRKDRTKTGGGWRLAGIRALLTSTAIAASCGVPAAMPPAGVSRPAVQFDSARLAELEEAFWICDYTATVRRASDTQIGVCADVYDALKVRKFGGDFDALLRWWQQNKAARHADLQPIEREPR